MVGSRRYWRKAGVYCSSGSVAMSKHDADCSRRREFLPFLCTCGVSENLANDLYSNDKREELLRSIDAAAKEQKKLILKNGRQRA